MAAGYIERSSKLMALQGALKKELPVADLHIVREHTLGLGQARKVALAWAAQMESDYRMQCTYQEGGTQDLLSFEGTGASGTLQVDKALFELNVRLGFLLGAFKEKIEAGIVKNLDAKLAEAATTKTSKAKK